MRFTGWQFRVKHLLILMAVVAVGMTYRHHLEPTDYWTGHYDLKVTLVGETESAITLVDAYPLEDDRVLTWFRANPASISGRDLPISVPLDTDRSFSVEIETDGRRSRSRRLVRYHQPQYLGVVLTLEDGTAQRLWVELPDGRESKEVELKIGPP